MYWQLSVLSVFTTLFLTAQAQEPDYNLSVLQLIVGVIIGLVPGLVTAFAARRKWYGGEQEVTQSQADVNQARAVESISSAAGAIATQSQALSEKSAALVLLLEEEVMRQKVIIEEERAFSRALKEEHSAEINQLKREVDAIQAKIEKCSTELLNLIADVRDKRPITTERLNQIEQDMV